MTLASAVEAMRDPDTTWVVPQPPFGAAPGPLVEDATVLAAFAAEDEVGHSPLLHVEGAALLVAGDVAAGLRIGRRVVLVRADLPDDLGHVRAALEAALAAEAMVLLDEESLLAGAVALQVLGLRLSTWDLWGADLDEGFDALRASAVGDQALPALTVDLPAVSVDSSAVTVDSFPSKELL